MKETRDLLMRTKRLFTSGHWTKGSLRSDIIDKNNNVKEQYCLIGGLRHANGHDAYSRPNDPAYLDAIELLSQEIGRCFREVLSPLTTEQKIVIFNDRIAKDSDDVVALIDRVVEKVPS